MVAFFLPAGTPLAPGVGSKGQNTFSESSQVVYHREWSIEHHESKYSVLTHSSPEMGSKGQIFNFFWNMVMLHIKLKGMKRASTW